MAFWKASVDGMQSKYSHSLFPDETANLSHSIDHRLLIPRLLSMVGFDLSPIAASHLESDPLNFEFVVSDFPTEIRAVCKQMNVAEQSQGLELLYQALETPRNEVRRRLFELAEAKILQAVSRAPSSNTGLLILGILLFHRALFLESTEPGSPHMLDLLKRAELSIREAIVLDCNCAFGGLPAAYLLSLVVLKHITCEQALRDGTSLDKSVAVDLQQWIVHSVRAQHSLLPVYLRHLLTLFRFLQNKACLSARSPRFDEPTPEEEAEYSSCVANFVIPAKLWPRMNLRSLNQSNRRNLQVLSAVQLLVDCLHLIATVDAQHPPLSHDALVALGCLRVDIYILHLFWSPWKGLFSAIGSYRELFQDRVDAYHRLVAGADSQLVPTGDYLYGEAATTGDRRLFLIASFIYSGVIRTLPHGTDETRMELLSRLIFCIFELPVDLQPLGDLEIAGWIEQLLHHDISLFWNLFHAAEPQESSEESAMKLSNAMHPASMRPSTQVGFERAVILTESSWFDDSTVLDGKTIRWLNFCSHSDSLRRLIIPLLSSQTQLRFALDTISDETFLGLSHIFDPSRIGSLSFSKSAGLHGNSLLPLHRFSSLVEFSLIDMSFPNADVLLSLATTLPSTIRALHFPSTQLPCDFLYTLVASNPALVGSLLTLEIPNQRALTDEEFLVAIPAMQSLATLNLSSCPKLTSRTVCAISCALGRSLVQLSLRSNKGIDALAVQALALQCTVLEALDLSFCKQLRMEASVVSKGGFHKLRIFNLQGCDRIGIDVITAAISQLPVLEVLDLRFVLLETCTAAAQEVIQPMIGSLFVKEKKHLPLSLFLGGSRQISAFSLATALSHCEHLHRLCDLDLSSLTSFLPPTSSQQLIRSLNTPGSPRSTPERRNTPAFSFADLLIKFSTLRYLSLANLSISDADCCTLHHHPDLRTVILADCLRLTNTTAGVLAQLPQLRSLNLRRTGISDSGIAMIAASCLRIEELILEGCKILTDHSCSSLANLKHLKKLSLKQCHLITAKGIEHLAPRAADFSPLKSLNLESISPRFGDSGVVHLSLRFPALQELNLAGLVEITDQSLIMLPLYLLQLRYLDLSFLRVSTDCAQHIAMHGRCLRRLHLVNCPLIAETKSLSRPGLQITVKEATKALVARVKELAQERNQRIRAEALQEVSPGSSPEIEKVVDEKIIQEVETRCSRSSYAPNTLLDVYSAEKPLPVFEALMKKLKPEL